MGSRWRAARVIVTAGGTVERIDPVRYITNDSSGQNGDRNRRGGARSRSGGDADRGADVTAAPPAGVERRRALNPRKTC